MCCEEKLVRDGVSPCVHVEQCPDLDDQDPPP